MEFNEALDVIAHFNERYRTRRTADAPAGARGCVVAKDQGTDPLEGKIDRIVAIRPMANEYKRLSKEVGDELDTRKLAEFTTAAGNCAKVSRPSGWKWVLQRLKDALPRAVFEITCPRTPDKDKLNQRLAACPEDKKLAGCRIPTDGRRKVQILAAGAAGGDDESDE